MRQVRQDSANGQLEAIQADTSVGLGVLFAKLQQGVVENRQVLTVARLRAEAEEVYGQRLSEIAPSVDKIQGGFSRDDGASTRKVRCNLQSGCSARTWRAGRAKKSSRHTKACGRRWRMQARATSESHKAFEI
jgi:hypothetical protein